MLILTLCSQESSSFFILFSLLFALQRFLFSVLAHQQFITALTPQSIKILLFSEKQCIFRYNFVAQLQNFQFLIRWSSCRHQYLVVFRKRHSKFGFLIKFLQNSKIISNTALKKIDIVNTAHLCHLSNYKKLVFSNKNLSLRVIIKNYDYVTDNKM